MKWIDCDKELPINAGYYLVYGNCTNDGLKCDIAYFTTSIADSGYFHKSKQPTHWMELPDAPGNAQQQVRVDSDKQNSLTKC